MRRLFNSAGYAGLIVAGELTEVVAIDHHPSEMKANEPVCTRSKLVEFVDANNVVIVKAHRYLRTDGTVGASGRIDPKWLRHDGVVYKQA